MVYLNFPEAEIRDVCCMAMDTLTFPTGNMYSMVGSKSAEDGFILIRKKKIATICYYRKLKRGRDKCYNCKGGK